MDSKSDRFENMRDNWPKQLADQIHEAVKSEEIRIAKIVSEDCNKQIGGVILCNIAFWTAASLPMLLVAMLGIISMVGVAIYGAFVVARVEGRLELERAHRIAMALAPEQFAVCYVDGMAELHSFYFDGGGTIRCIPPNRWRLLGIDIWYKG